MTPKPDNRPRFGWTDSMDRNPQRIHEFKDATKIDKEWIPVVVIPMPGGGKAYRARVMRLWKDYWWPQ